MSQTPQPGHASLGRRVGAYLVDATLVTIALGVTYAVQLAGLAGGSSSLLVVGLALTLVVGFGYPVAYIAIQGRTGATPGKSLLGIRTVDAESGEPIGFGRALVRQLVLGVLGPINLVQLVTIPKSPRRQGWHDSAARSVVIPVHAVTGGATTSTLAAGASVAAQPGPRAAEPWPSSTLPDLASGRSDARPRSTPSAGPPPPPPPPPAVGPPPSPLVPPPGAPPVAVQLPGAAGSARPGVIAPPPTGAERPADLGAAAAEAPWVLSTAAARNALGGMLLVGRDPNPELIAGAGTWSVDDPELSVSKTHALFGLDGDLAWVEDWHSTNGTVLHRGGEPRRLAPHDRTELRVGDRIDLGDLTISVTKDFA